MFKSCLRVSSAILIAGCGATPTAPAMPPAFHQVLSGTLEAGFGSMQPLAIPRDGTMTIVLTWPEPDVDLLLYLTSFFCEPGQCHVYDIDVGPNGNSRKLVRTVAEGEAFQIIVNNLFSATTAHYTVAIDIR